MYYVHEVDSADIIIDEPTTNPYGTLADAFRTVYSKFAGGPLGTENVVDYLFGIAVVILLLNVVIAQVQGTWADATAEANDAFWKYRLGEHKSV